MVMKKIFLGVVIALLILLAGCDLGRTITTNSMIEQVKNSSDTSRMILVEYIEGGNMQIFYDKYTNVMYVFNYKGGFSPIYNADGSLYLYGTPKSVG